MLPKIILIIPYFGVFKSYFTLFIESCKKNNNVNWLILTDNNLENLPENVITQRITFQELKNLISCRLKFDFRLDTPYKLCDYKPAYGLIFQDYIKDYDYWGYCDCDLIFGDLNKFLLPIIQKGYDKIFAAGHLTLYKNTPENNCLFLGTAEENESVFNNPKTVGFDEAFYNRRNIHRIFLDNNKKVFENDYSANPAVRREQFVLMKYDPNKKTFVEKPYRKTMFIWDNGTIRGLYVENDQLKGEEYIYMHFQNRNMQLAQLNGKTKWDKYYIVPNRFIPLEDIPTTVNEWLKYDLEPKNTQLRDIKRADFRHKLNRIKEIFLN